MESEKITAEEIEQARILCQASVEARELMLNHVTKIVHKFLTTGLDPTLSSDWFRFRQVLHFLQQKEVVLEKRGQELLGSMRAAAEAGRIPLMSVEDLTGEHCA